MTSFSDDHAILLENTLPRYRKVLEENRRLQEDIKTRDVEHKGVLNDLMAELKQLKQQSAAERTRSTSRRRVRKKTCSVQVPLVCRVSTCIDFESI